jgi:hypothetical protein
VVKPALQRELMDQLSRLAEEHQERVLEFARSLASKPPIGRPGQDWLGWSGLIPAQDLREMERAIEEGCERIDENGWQSPP